MIFRLGGFDYIKVAPGDMRLHPCVADYLGLVQFNFSIQLYFIFSTEHKLTRHM